MTSNFRKKKLTYLFKICFDVDGKDTITKKDTENALQRICNYKGWKQGYYKYEDAEELMNKIWEAMLWHAGLDKEELTVDEWIKIWGDYCESALGWHADFCGAIFHLQDINNDGKIDRNDFVNIHTSFGHPETETSVAFDKFANGKTSVNYQDFRERWKELMCSEDPNAPGNFIFGNLTFE